MTSERILMVGREAAPFEQATESAARTTTTAARIRKRRISAHREAAQTLRLLRVFFDAVDPRRGGAHAAKGRELGHALRSALEDGLDGAVGQVADPAIDTQCARSLPGRVAKRDALHAPTHDQVLADPRRMLHAFAVLPPWMGAAEPREAIVDGQSVAAPRGALESRRYSRRRGTMDRGFSTLLGEAKRLLPEAIELRRRIHRRPELGLELPLTRAAVLESLAGLPLELETSLKTSGVVATLHGKGRGRTILLRADMDALPLEENTGLDFASERKGVMHACGHDAHIAMLAAAARLLAARREEFSGSVKLLFQPGEEGFGGARILIGEGLLEHEPRPEGAFAIHVDPTLPPGCVATRPGPIMASGDLLSIDLTGKGGHASMPHHAVDPIPVACEIVLALQSLVTRRADAFDPVVVSITRVQAGSTDNVIPATAHLLGTIRTVSERARRSVHEGVRRVVLGVAAAHEVEAKIQLIDGYPVTVNHEGFARFAQQVASELAGSGSVIEMKTPIMGAEDFSYILQGVPGAMVFLGVRPQAREPAPLHSNRMVLDENALATGIALHAAMALRFLEHGIDRNP